MIVDTKDINNLKYLFEYIKVLDKDGFSIHNVQKIKELLEYSRPHFRHLILEGSFPELVRLSINQDILGENRRIKNISYLKYPPADKVSRFGRCNLPEQSVLYAGFMRPTILNELKPKTGTLITSSTWKIKNNSSMFYCPVFMNQPTNGTINRRTEEFTYIFEKTIADYPENEKNLIRYLTQFIADSFSKRVTSENDLEYFLSAFFSNIIFNEMNYGKVEAILYPSVQEHLAFENIAIKPEVFDEKYELVKVSDTVVIESVHQGNGRYFMHEVGSTSEFDLINREVIWNQTHEQFKEQINKIETKYNIKI